MLFSVEVNDLINFTYHYNTFLMSSLRCSHEAQEANMGDDRTIPRFLREPNILNTHICYLKLVCLLICDF